jgi:DNA/RNA-binding domain of Phe-tRNA-synthetase-like protein
MSSEGPRVRPGWIDAALARELPGLQIVWVEALAPAGRPTAHRLDARLRALADRYAGPRAVTMRREAVPAAYRAFSRHVGLDPDVDRPPVEALVVERLLHGGFRSRGRIEDALLVGALETGVPLWALDADRLDGPLGVRPARAGERLGHGDLAPDIAPGRLVVADARAPVALLLGAVGAPFAPGPATRRLAVVAVRVAGVPAIHVEEALWACLDALAA